jgi:hypothetical protein
VFYFNDLLIPSEDLNIGVSEKCYFGIFPNTNGKDADAIYLGQLYLQKYYTYFDISGYQEGLTSTLVIGYGVKNEKADIL